MDAGKNTLARFAEEWKRPYAAQTSASCGGTLSRWWEPTDSCRLPI